MRTPLHKGEQILLVTFSSWTLLVLPFLVGIIFLVAAYFIIMKWSAWGWLAALAGIGYFYFRYALWKANIWVVTNFRVIDETGLLNHFAKESPLDKINNVSYDQTVVGRLFNYGHVKIQTAAQIGATDYFNVNHPKRLKDTITAAQADHANWQTGQQARQMAEAINALRPPGSASGPAAGSAAASTQAASSNINVAAELEKLFELKMKGALSEEEFNRAKNRLLGQ
jgi:membrane protein YdbS with pleckstrin-like domain